MKRNGRTIVALTALLMCLTACGQTDDSSKSEGGLFDSKPAETSAAEVDDGDDDLDEIDDDSDDEDYDDDYDEDDDGLVDDASSAAEEFVERPFELVEGLSTKYADASDLTFAYDGKVFKLGETTLQDMIDAGVPFSESDLKAMDEDIEKDHSSSAFSVEASDFVTLGVRGSNFTDGTMKIKDCPVGEILVSYYYVPRTTLSDEENEEARKGIDAAADHLCLSFPLNATKEQLMENNKDYSEDGGDYLDYSVSSELYYGAIGYHIEFEETTNQVDKITMSWYPG